MDKILNPAPPEVLQGAFSWHASELLLPRLALLNVIGGWLTLWDSFGTPGDTLLAGTLGRIIKQRYPRLKINCITPNPELLEHDPDIARLNGAPSLILLRFWYVEIIHRKIGNVNILAPTLARVGIRNYEYRTRVFLAERELMEARRHVGEARRPIVTINVQSREMVKVWSESRWKQLVERLRIDFEVIQLGAHNEPELEHTVRLAGKLTLRQSMACLSLASLHVGCVSFLMHAANGLDVPSVIIYGGRETPENSGYARNINLYSPVPCSPCWLHDSRGDRCANDMKCMSDISVDRVFEACTELIKRNQRS